MSHTKTITVYSFNELSEEAQDRAISDFRNNGVDTQYLYDEAHKSANTFCNTFGVKTSSRSWLDFDSENVDTEGTLKGLRLQRYLVLNPVLTKTKPYGKMRTLANGKFDYPYHSKCQFQETCCPFTGVCYDEYLLSPIRKFIARPDTTTTYEDLMRECLESLRISLDSEDEYANSDKAIAEILESNDYEFTEQGETL